MTWGERLKVLIGALVVAGLVWVAMYVYWHLKIVSAIRTMENQGGPPKAGSAATREGGYSMSDDALDDIEDAGCRSLPYLVAALFTTKNPAATMACADLIRKLTAPDATDPPGKIRSECPNPRLLIEDQAEERARKCEPIRTWWNGHAKEYHEGWRIWSGHCPRK